MGLSGRGGWYHWPASVPASPRVESVPPDRPAQLQETVLQESMPEIEL